MNTKLVLLRSSSRKKIYGFLKILVWNGKIVFVRCRCVDFEKTQTKKALKPNWNLFTSDSVFYICGCHKRFVLLFCCCCPFQTVLLLFVELTAWDAHNLVSIGGATETNSVVVSLLFRISPTRIQMYTKKTFAVSWTWCVRSNTTAANGKRIDVCCDLCIGSIAAHRRVWRNFISTVNLL